jgi:hypothetical protein
MKLIAITVTEGKKKKKKKLVAKANQIATTFFP